MKVKKVKVYGNEYLYFCPKCNKGHLLDYGQKQCDICHTKLEWEDENLPRNKKQ